MAKNVDKLASSMAVHMNLEEDERISLLDETDDDDVTPPLTAKKTNFAQVVVWAENKPKFVPKNIITAPVQSPRVPQPQGTSVGQINRPSAGPVNFAHRLPAAARLRQRIKPYSRPPKVTPSQANGVGTTLPQPTVYFPVPPPIAPVPKFSQFMINSLCSNLLMHSADNFNMKLDVDEVKKFLMSAKKSYCN